MFAGRVFTSLQPINHNQCPLSPSPYGSANSSAALMDRLSFSEGGRRNLFDVPGADPADAAGGQPGYRGDAAP